MECLRLWLIADSLCLILAKWRYYATESPKIKEMWIKIPHVIYTFFGSSVKFVSLEAFLLFIYLFITCIGVKREVCLHFNFRMLVFPQAGKQTKWSDILGFMCTKKKKLIIILVGLPLSLCSQLTTWRRDKLAEGPQEPVHLCLPCNLQLTTVPFYVVLPFGSCINLCYLSPFCSFSRLHISPLWGLALCSSSVSLQATLLYLSYDADISNVRRLLCALSSMALMGLSGPVLGQLDQLHLPHHKVVLCTDPVPSTENSNARSGLGWGHTLPLDPSYLRDRYLFWSEYLFFSLVSLSWLLFSLLWQNIWQK